MWLFFRVDVLHRLANASSSISISPALIYISSTFGMASDDLKLSMLEDRGSLSNAINFVSFGIDEMIAWNVSSDEISQIT